MNNRTAWLHLIILLAAFSLGMVVDAYTPLWIKQKVIYPDVEVTDQDVVPRGVGRFDEHLGWALRPGARAISTATGEPVLYSINAEGLRDSPIPLSKPAGEFRILVLGDSRTFGFGVQLQDHFTTKLEAYFKNVQVINAGVN